jgi:hypothetical protein
MAVRPGAALAGAAHDADMKVALTVNDFLRAPSSSTRTASAIVDEPDPAGRVVGHDHLRRDGRAAAAMAAALDAIGIAVGERVAVVSHNSAVC